MVASTVRRLKTLFLIGALLTILGSFLPWRCSGDIFWYCSAGLDFNFGILALINPSAAVMIVAVLMAVLLIASAVDLIQRWRFEISAVIIVSALLYLLIDKGIVADNGGLTILILCSIALWGFFRSAEFTRHSDLVITVSILLLVGISIYQTISVLLKQIAEGHIIGVISLQFGLPIVLIGSLLMLVAQWWKHHSRDYQKI